MLFFLFRVVQSKNERRVVLYVRERGASQLSRKERALLFQLKGAVKPCAFSVPAMLFALLGSPSKK